MRRKKPSFRMIMIGSYTVIILLTMGVFSWSSLKASEKALTGLAHEDMQKLVEAKNEILDMSFYGIREASLNLLVDKQLYELLLELDQTDPVAVQEANEEAKSILQKYFYSYPQISAVSMVTDFYTFGYGNTDMVYDESFFEGDLYHEVEEKRGGVLLSPAEGGHFSMLRVMNLTLVEDSGMTQELDLISPRPVLIIDFKNEVYRDEMQSLLSQDKSQYMVVSEDETIVSHSNSSLVGKHIDSEWVAGKDLILCEKTSPVTGWTTVITLSKDMLMKDVLANIRKNVLLFLLLSVMFAGGMSALLTRKITGSIDQLISAVKRMGTGDFDKKVSGTNIPEF